MGKYSMPIDIDVDIDMEKLERIKKLLDEIKISLQEVKELVNTTNMKSTKIKILVDGKPL